jgi:predicted amidohydrolase YtcJ
VLIQRARISDDKQCVDIRCQGGRVVALADHLAAQPGEHRFDARGGAVLPGLHDHHLHLYATAAARTSICCGPPAVNDRDQLLRSLRAAVSGDSWLRGVAYHESVAGLPDRWQLDAMVAERPLRIQHRSGKMWLLNSAAVVALALDSAEVERSGSGIERDARGRATGRLFRMDDWLRQRLLQLSGADGSPIPHSLAEVSALLASYGVTGLTDAGANNGAETVASLTLAMQRGQLRQKVLLMGRDDLPEPVQLDLTRGAVKILLDDHCLPTFAALQQRIDCAHEQQRAVAIHCVTATELVFALSALLEAGARLGDRIEHASLAPDDALPLMQQAGIAVVTQPAFIYQRGDQYRRGVPSPQHHLLYRASTFIAEGIPLAGSSDAPYGDLDPWLAMRTAVQRRSREGFGLGIEEALNPEQALALYTSPAEQPGAQSRRVAVGAVADLCVLDRPWQQARVRLSADDVAATVRDGIMIFQQRNSEID